MVEKRDILDKMRLEIRGNTSDLLAERMRDLIMSGEIPAGYTFPNETVFCELLGVSRSTLREAYKALECTGFIRRVRRVGTVVNDFTDISKAAPLSTSLIMSDYEELMEFRVMIEAELARLAAQRATEEHIARMDGFLKSMKDSGGNLEELTYYDTLFHMEIAKASGNRILVSTMENAKELFQKGMYEAFQVDTPTNVQEALLFHTRILDALRRRDCEAAYALMRQHIGSVSLRMVSRKSKQESIIMRFAVSIITPEVQGEAPLALLAGDFDQRLAKAASYGYQGVELVTCDPARLDGGEIARQLARHGLASAAVATGFIAASRGLTLSSPDGAVRRQAASLLEELVRFSAAVGSKVVTIGSFRGKNHPAAAENLQASLSGVDALASSLGVSLALEPINAGESDFLTDAAQVCRFIDQSGFQAVGLLLDTYHVFLSEPDPLESFRLYRRQLAHVHLADSERKAAGCGTIDFAGVERVLEETGYAGWQSAELARAGEPDGNARRTIDFLRADRYTWRT